MALSKQHRETFLKQKNYFSFFLEKFLQKFSKVCILEGHLHKQKSLTIAAQLGVNEYTEYVQ